MTIHKLEKPVIVSWESEKITATASDIWHHPSHKLSKRRREPTFDSAIAASNGEAITIIEWQYVYIYKSNIGKKYHSYYHCLVPVFPCPSTTVVKFCNYIYCNPMHSQLFLFQFFTWLLVAASMVFSPLNLDVPNPFTYQVRLSQSHKYFRLRSKLN